MERIAFLVEETNQRIGCLLNPEGLVVRRTAGTRRRQSLSGPLTGTGLSDDPLLFTGGGRTELELDLLFDISLAGSSVATEDVRDLTGPIWSLSENSGDAADARRRPPLVRLVWGKSWNVLGVVVSVAERLEHFSSGGAPQRSWMRLCFRRVSEPSMSRTSAVAASSAVGTLGAGLAAGSAAAQGVSGMTSEMIQGLEQELHNAPELLESHQVIGSSQSDDAAVGERVDQLADQYLGDAGLWPILAQYNDLLDPLRLPAGLILHIPWLNTGGTP